MKYYHIYCLEKLVQPEIIKRKTKEHWDENDIYNMYINEQLKVEIIPGSITDHCPKGKPNDKFLLTMTALFIDFSSWHRKQFGSTEPVPKRDMVRYQMDQRLGESKSVKGWVGWTLIQTAVGVGFF